MIQALDGALVVKRENVRELDLGQSLQGLPVTTGMAQAANIIPFLSQPEKCNVKCRTRLQKGVLFNNSLLLVLQNRSASQ